MKTLNITKPFEQEAVAVLQETLGRAGKITEYQWLNDFPGCLDLRFEITRGQGRGKIWRIHAMIKAVLHPQQASHAIWSLKNRQGHPQEPPTYPVLIAPFISESVASMCGKERVGHLDLSGNCNLEFGGIWIERRGLPRKYKEERGQKSLYTPKASRTLRVLLQGPLVPQKVENLAEAANVSLGLVSKVRQLLLEQELAEDSKEGIRIKGEVGASSILRDWLLEDDFSKRTQVREYSTLASDFKLAGNLVAFCRSENSVSNKDPLFTLNFAAWLRAPHNVPTTVSAYLDRFPEEGDLLSFLNARPVSRGAGNLRILVPDDYQAMTIGRQHSKELPDLSLVSDLQLFLDLSGGEPNGNEQAAVLREREDFNGGWR